MTARNAFFTCAAICFFLLSNSVAQNSAPKLAVLDANGMESVERQSVTAQLSLLWLRENMSLLDTDKSFLRNFILVNNCTATDREYAGVLRALSNEFDAPAVVSFYKQQGPGVLNLVSNTFTVTMQRTLAPNGGPMGFWLGQYDMEKKSFPFVNLRGGPLPSPITLNSVAPGDARGGRCMGGVFPGAQYKVTFKEVKLTDLHMDDVAARAYVSSIHDVSGRPRPVYIQLDLEILPGAPQVSKDHPPLVILTGKVNKVTAIRVDDGRPLGVLYP